MKNLQDSTLLLGSWMWLVILLDSLSGDMTTSSSCASILEYQTGLLQLCIWLVLGFSPTTTKKKMLTMSKQSQNPKTKKGILLFLPKKYKCKSDLNVHIYVVVSTYSKFTDVKKQIDKKNKKRCCFKKFFLHFYFCVLVSDLKTFTPVAGWRGGFPEIDIFDAVENFTMRHYLWWCPLPSLPSLLLEHWGYHWQCWAWC